MIKADDAARNLAGAWGMIWDLPGWEDRLDASVDGVFRSFWAIAAAAPFSVLAFASLRRASQSIPEFQKTSLLEAPLGLVIFSELVGFVLDWTLSLFALVMIARRLGAQKNIARLIVGFNWSQVFAGAVLAMPATAMGLTGSLDFGAALFLPTLAFGAAILWGVLRRSLPLNIAMTAAAIVLLVLIGVIATSAVNGFMLMTYEAVS